MTVDDLLNNVSSQELAEWEAYERALGPVGRQYDQDMLARIHEQLQMLTYVVGATNSEKDKNPVPEPQQVPRPADVFKRLTEEAESDPEAEAEMTLDGAVAMFQARQRE